MDNRLDLADDVGDHMLAVDRRLGVWDREWDVEYRWMAVGHGVVDDYEKPKTK